MRTIFLIATFLLLMATGTALAFNPVGKYSYKEKGFKGEMTVTESVGVPNVMQYKIFTVSKDGHDCDIEGVEFDRIASASSIESMVMSKPEVGAVVSKFSVKFTPKGASIEITEPGSGCGMRGSYSGKWGKINSSKK